MKIWIVLSTPSLIWLPHYYQFHAIILWEKEKITKATGQYEGCYFFCSFTKIA